MHNNDLSTKAPKAKLTKTFKSTEYTVTALNGNYLVDLPFSSTVYPYDVELYYNTSNYIGTTGIKGISNLMLRSDGHTLSVIFYGVTTWTSDIMMRYREG